MASFTLALCGYREGWLVRKRGAEPFTVDWKGLCDLLAPSKSLQAKRSLRLLAASTFVGTIRQPNGAITNFIVRNTDLSGDIRDVVKRNPRFAESIASVYLVTAVQWEDRMLEAASISPSVG